MPAIIAEFAEKAKEAADAIKYAGILTGSLDSVKSLFDKLDANGNGLLEKAELKEVVSKYNGEAFNEAQFFGWFDTHGVRARPRPQRRATHGALLWLPPRLASLLPCAWLLLAAVEPVRRA